MRHQFSKVENLQKIITVIILNNVVFGHVKVQSENAAFIYLFFTAKVSLIRLHSKSCLVYNSSTRSAPSCRAGRSCLHCAALPSGSASAEQLKESLC